MPLLPPSVLAPLSPCSRAVVVRGALPGARVEIFAGSRRVAQEVAAAPEQTFALDAGEELRGGELVRAVQSMGGERSPDHADWVEVMRTLELPRGLRVVWLSRVHERGRCLALVGLLPGTRVTIRGAGGETLAEGQAVDTTLRLHLSRPVGAGDMLVAVPEACGISGREWPAPLMVSFANATLPPPTVAAPLQECGTRVYVGDAYEGVTVELRRTGPLGERRLGGCFDHPQLYFGLGEAERLRVGEMVSARQGYPDGGPWSEFSELVRVEPRESLPRPRIVEPLCPGSTRVVVHGLGPGAVVRLRNNGTELGRASAADVTDTFLTPALEPGTITAEQELCGILSGESDPTVVGPIAALEPPRATAPYRCGTVVHVGNLRPNARVRIRSQLGTLGEATAASGEALVRVPTLNEGDSLVVSETVCGGREVSTTVYVRPLPPTIPEPGVPRILLSSARSVVVTQVLPGAIVEVFVNDRLRGTVESGTEQVEVPLLAPVAANDMVAARQRICGQESPSRSVRVRPCRRRVRVGLKCLDPSHVSLLRRQAAWMRDLYGFHGFAVEVVGPVEVLDLPELMTVTEDNVPALLRHRNGLGERDIAVYMAQVTLSRRTGGFHREGDWGVAVSASGEDWSVAHEVGHALGLPDAGGFTRLMHIGSRREGMDPNPTDPATALIPEELSQMERSPFALPC